MQNSLQVYSNGIKCLNDIRKDYDPNKIVFIGNMRTLQNQDAVKYFVEKIFPLIKNEIPGVVFYIIGAEPTEIIQKMSDHKHIFVTGYVESVEDMINDAAAAVAPVRIAAGIQNKVLISMGCGIPVVLTSVIAASIPELISGINCEIADEPEEFAKAVIRIMLEKNFRNTIARNGYDLMRTAYSWNEKLKGYEDGI